MAAPRRIFKNINQLKLSSWTTFVIVVSLLGSLSSLAVHQWLQMATSQAVDLTSSPPSGETTGSDFDPIFKRLDVDVVLIVDWSGSMNGEQGSDPENLRLRASEIMASSLAADIFPRHTRMGYLQFAKTAVIAQEIVDVEDKNSRAELISKIYDLSSQVPENSDWTSLTNISDAFVTASSMLDEIKSKNDPKFASNTPAIVFLTDGRPTNGETSANGLESIVSDVLDKGTVIFVVILRNPSNPDPDNVYGTVDSPQNFAFWRSFWYRISSEHPEQVKYFEAQDDTQLEGIYNTIRAQLVKEGTKPADRLEYDPLDPSSVIEIPPDLLQAHLLVNRPTEVQSIELIAPDGLSFQEDILRDPQNNEILEGNLFYRFSMYKPIPGNWKLVTDATQTLYYLLITESIYTAQPYAAGGAPYVEPDKPTELLFAVVDDQQEIVNTKVFELKAYSSQTVKKEDGSYAEELVVLANLQPITENGETKYIFTVTPELVAGQDTLQIQIDGASSDGSLVNFSSYTIPVLPAPSELQLEIPESVTCDSSKLVFWPPAIQCGNEVMITASVKDSELISQGSFHGKIYFPGETQGAAMELLDTSSLRAELGPLQSVGRYQIVVDVEGKIEGGTDDFQWHKRELVTIRVEWPSWIEPLKHCTWYLFVLLMIVTLWKPVFVAMLLPLFAVIRVAPSGFYTDHDDASMPAQIYDLAMKRRKLFSLSIGISKNCDIPVYAAQDPTENSFTSRRFDRFRLKLYRWLKARPVARVVSVPWSGAWVEKPSGEFEKASERTYTSINVNGVIVRIGQRDWKDEDFNH